MQVTKTKNIEVDDMIECLTEDGWEWGKVTAITEDKITVFLAYINEKREFTFDLIKF